MNTVYAIANTITTEFREHLSSTWAVTTRVLFFFLFVFFLSFVCFVFPTNTVCRMDGLTVGRSVGRSAGRLHTYRQAGGRTGRQANEQLYDQTDVEMDARTGTNRRTSRQLGKTEAIHPLNVFQSWWQKRKLL